jgi:hypothetical protein
MLVSFDNYDADDDEALVSGKGAQCYKKFERVKADDNGDYVYTSTSQHYM